VHGAAALSAVSDTLSGMSSQPDPVRVHRLLPREWPRLRLLRLHALRDAPDAFSSSLAEAIARPGDAWQQQVTDLASFVAVLDGADVGMVRGELSAEEPGVVWLLSMWVDPEARGRGVGDALVAAVIDFARAEGSRTVQLDVADDNAPAIALYARHGFAPTGAVGSLPPPREHVAEHRRALTLDG
jgi:ribosomal protein S18 acetylase RimI-like enzyme